jgi:hypothetical protein
MGMVSQSVEKLEHLLYKQSLMMMTGREKFISGVEETWGLGVSNSLNNHCTISNRPKSLSS